MQKLFISLLLLICLSNLSYASIVQGGVEKEHAFHNNRVIDSSTNTPISGAKISLPLENYSTTTDSQGKFSLNAIDGQTVMSVEKDGYKPFSMTIDQKIASVPMVLGIEKSTPKDITIETQMFHLGDNNFSPLSANAGEFQVQSLGPYYSKQIKIPQLSSNTKVSLVVGSIIGIDTKLAKQMGQNRVSNAYASPPEVIFNGNKIAEIQVNGDGQRVKIPFNLIKQNQLNEITIRTGKNLMQTAYVDYDDIEFMNLTIETE